ncbi:MAG: hypothetical protein GEU87_10625 [Alphaproteobacteria bacterium]|nr:hypothetical protein [Alphaproteobacteria bacterium]
MPTIDDMLESWWSQLNTLPKSSKDNAIAAALKERAEDLCWQIAAHHAIGLPGLTVKLRLIDRDARGGGGGWTPVNIRTSLESLQRMQEPAEAVAACHAG